MLALEPALESELIMGLKLALDQRGLNHRHYMQLMKALIQKE